MPQAAAQTAVPVRQSPAAGNDAETSNAFPVSITGRRNHAVFFQHGVDFRLPLVMSGLGAESAVFRAAPGFSVYNGAEFDSIAQKTMADAIGNAQQLDHIGAVRFEELRRLGERQKLAPQYLIAASANNFFHKYSFFNRFLR
jgi:hypothetical protein